MNKKTNDKILKLLKEYLNKYPDQRFCQALVNINILKIHERIVKSNEQWDGAQRIPEDPFYTTNEEVINLLEKEL